MDDTAPRSRRSGLTSAALLGACGLMFYILSVGPIIALVNRGVFDGWDETIILCYAPLIWLHEGIPAVRPPIEAWINLWDTLL